jgi:UDP-galactopyranose mutase
MGKLFKFRNGKFQYREFLHFCQEKKRRNWKLLQVINYYDINVNTGFWWKIAIFGKKSCNGEFYSVY